MCLVVTVTEIHSKSDIGFCWQVACVNEFGCGRCMLMLDKWIRIFFSDMRMEKHWIRPGVGWLISMLEVAIKWPPNPPTLQAQVQPQPTIPRCRLPKPPPLGWLIKPAAVYWISTAVLYARLQWYCLMWWGWCLQMFVLVWCLTLYINIIILFW